MQLKHVNAAWPFFLTHSFSISFLLKLLLRGPLYLSLQGSSWSIVLNTGKLTIKMVKEGSHQLSPPSHQPARLKRAYSREYASARLEAWLEARRGAA